MADIRINALATTATTPASDDYLALDGTAQGTRKILATNIANNVTDVILGSSGPSVKSTLSARAPRQGLVFDGSGSNGTFTAVPIGSGNFSVSALVNVTNLAIGRVISRGSAWEFGVSSDGRIYLYNNTTLLFSTSLVPIGKACLVSYTKSASSGTFYLNGISAGTVTDNNTYTSASEIGGNASANAWLGTIQSFLIYNRALSASEVVALYESGAPAGADYNSASNTAINTSAVINSANAAFDYDTFTGASATGFTAGVTSSVNGSFASVNGAAYSVVTGTRYLATFSATLTSGTAPRLSFGSSVLSNLVSNVHIVTAGSNSVIFTITATASRDLYFHNLAGESTNYTISGLSVTRLGLLLAPDAAQAGGGLVWYDTSGNAANITLPASGVSWNVPSSGYWGGNLTVNGTGTSSVGGSFGIGTTAPTTINGVASAFQQVANVTGSGTCALNITGTQAILSLVDSNASANVKWLTLTNSNGVSSLGVLNDAGSTAQTGFQFFHSTGNFLFGTGNDSGNGKLQLATHTNSAGGIGFGSDVALYRAGGNTLKLELGVSAGALWFDNGGDGAGGARILGSSGAITITSNGANSLYLQTGGITALTLDSSRRAQFASIVGIGASPTTGIYVTLQGDPGTLTYTNADSWIGYRSAVERAGTTGVGYGMVSQLRVASGTQTYGVGISAEIPGGSGTVTNFQHIRIGGRDLITGNYAIYDNSGYDTRLGGTLITQAGTASTPASASATGTAGMIKWDASYIYVCTATNTWKRVAIATWP